MRILAIETSCDDTGIAVIEAKGGLKRPFFKILANLTHSQIELHSKWNGVVPFLAKREHSKNLIPLLERTLAKAKLLKENKKGTLLNKNLEILLNREPELLFSLKKFLQNFKTPKIDVIAVTYGPGLEPALWTGVNLSRTLSLIWEKPLIPINHMEGHIFSSFLEKKDAKIDFPSLALLISGGHTELVLIKNWMKYKILGRTRDDAVGEAFDKVARMIGLPYPGGPGISRLAEEFILANKIGLTFPRPMINSNDFDFSFSGLKTAVLYKIKELGELTDNIKKEIAFEFEESVVDTLISKTKKALKKYGVKTLIIGGGVSANKKIRETFRKMIDEEFSDSKIYIPERSFSVDNAAMIAVAGYFRYLKDKTKFEPIKIKKLKASGNLTLSK